MHITVTHCPPAPSADQKFGSMLFYDTQNNVVGELDWHSGTVEFRGKATESAVIFIKAVKTCWPITSPEIRHLN